MTYVKLKFCCHLFRTCMNFVFTVEHRRIYFLVASDFHSMGKKILGASYQHFLKYILCSTEEKKFHTCLEQLGGE